MGNRERAIADRLCKWEIQFRAGHKARFLDAMNLCLSFDIPIPTWALAHFFEGAGKYMNAKVTTLDDAFDVHRPKGWRQPKEAHRITHGLRAHVKARYLTQTGMAVKPAVAEVAENLSMSEPTAERYYYDEQLMDELGRHQFSKKTDDDR